MKITEFKLICDSQPSSKFARCELTLENELIFDELELVELGGKFRLSLWGVPFCSVDELFHYIKAGLPPKDLRRLQERLEQERKAPKQNNKEVA